MKPAPDATEYNFDQLVRAAGVPARTVRYYIDRGLLERPPFRSSATRYSQNHLIRLRAIAHLRKEERLKLDAIAAQLAAASADELLRLAGMAPPPAPEPPPAPPEPTPAPPPEPTPEPPPAAAVRELPAGDFIGPYRPALAMASERWEHIAICPGVELQVRTEADAEAWRVASEIVRLFGRRG